VEHGADVSKENRNGETPSFIVCMRRNDARDVAIIKIFS